MQTDWGDYLDHARRYFRLKFPKYRDLSEDFAQWCATKLLEGKYQTHDGFFRMGLDYLRREYRHHNGRLDLDKARKVSGEDQVFNSEVAEASKHLESKDRAIFMLFYKWDFSNDEIGELFGMTGNSVGMRIFNLRNKIKKANKYN